MANCYATVTETCRDTGRGLFAGDWFSELFFGVRGEGVRTGVERGRAAASASCRCAAAADFVGIASWLGGVPAVAGGAPSSAMADGTTAVTPVDRRTQTPHTPSRTRCTQAEHERLE